MAGSEFNGFIGLLPNLRPPQHVVAWGRPIGYTARCRENCAQSGKISLLSITTAKILRLEKLRNPPVTAWFNWLGRNAAGKPMFQRVNLNSAENPDVVVSGNDQQGKRQW